MELSEKIQKLRKARGLTQEEFAKELFVSRTAVSKWETGRGVPGMESLQMIAKVCNVTLDELLRAEEVLAVAQQENKGNMNRFAGAVDGICNLAALVSMVLPLYKWEMEGAFRSVPLYRFDGWQAAVYWSLSIAMTVCGVAQLATGRQDAERLRRGLNLTGVVIHTCAIVFLILSGQPYPAVLFLTLLLIKLAVALAKKK